VGPVGTLGQLLWPHDWVPIIRSPHPTQHPARPVFPLAKTCSQLLSDPMRELLDDLCPELVHKLPPKKPQS